MNLADAKNLLPEIRETLGLASEEWSESYNVAKGRSELCSKDRMTGRVEPMATILPECGFADQRLILNARTYLAALDALFVEACRVIRSQEPPEATAERERHRKEKETDHAQQCGRLCNDRVFRRYLLERHQLTDQSDIERINTRVRHILAVQSRAELNTDPSALARWKNLLADFYAWRKL